MPTPAGRWRSGAVSRARRQSAAATTLEWGIQSDDRVSYPISVVIPTSAGWPKARLAIEPLLPQVRAHGGQLLVADVSGQPPPAHLLAPDVMWLERPGEWVTRARREAYGLAEAPIVAITEDHCVVAPDWVERVLEAHARHPDAAAISGAVVNGSTDAPSEWALYICAHVRLAPPLDGDPPLAGKTSISYRREVLARMPRDGGASIEDIFNQRLRAAGERIIADDSIRVAHHQAGGLGVMCGLQFHNGRTIAGLRRSEMTAGDWARALLPVPLAAFRLGRVLLAARRKALPREVIVAAAPHMAVMLLAHAVGEVLGYASGPGDSPQHLH